MNVLKIIPFFCLVAFLISCKNTDVELPLEKMATYDVIQSQIWDTQCISCHTAGQTFATQSDLILTADQSYNQLVNRAPDNKQALEDGLELVGTEGLPSLFKSFLWEKINANDLEHFYDDHPEYGAIMPLGGDFLTNGELEFIRDWIINGAPAEGIVADVALLADKSRFEELPFEPLEKPENGIQFHLGPFDVQANQDREFFYYEPSISDEDIYVNQIEISMRPGSHHFLFYGFEDETPSFRIPEAHVMRDLYDENQNLNTINFTPTCLS